MAALWLALTATSTAGLHGLRPVRDAMANDATFPFERTAQTLPPKTSAPTKPGTPRSTSPGFWYSPQIVEDRRAPVQGAPIRPVPIPPMFPTPASPGLPSAVQPPSPGGRR
jgi:hypothetical protein